MSRKVILDFLNEYDSFLKANGLNYLSICLFDKYLSTKAISKILNNKQITIYHINSPRIYQKEYAYDKLNDTILNLFENADSLIKINKEDITEAYKDPFYLKDIRNIDFTTLIIYPINDQEIKGFLLFYFNNPEASSLDQDSFKISLNKIINLRNNIIIDECEKIIYVLHEKLIKQEEYAIFYQYENQVFVNNNAKKMMKIKDDFFELTNEDNLKRWSKIKKNKICREFKYLNGICYYIKANLINDLINVYPIELIDEHKNEQYNTLIFDYYDGDNLLNQIDRLIKACKHLTLDDNNYCFYKVSDHSLIWPLTIKLTIEEQMIIEKNLNNNQFIFLNKVKDYKLTMNLKNLVIYLDEVIPECFSLDKYISYQKYLNEKKLNDDYQIKKITGELKLIKSSDNTEKGTLFTLPPLYNQTKPYYYNYQNNIEKNYREALTKTNKLIITLLSSTIKTRKTLEIVKYLLINDSEPWIIIHHDLRNDLLTEKILGDNIVKFRNMGVKIIIDSSIYLNTHLAYFETIIDGIYFNEDECQSINDYPDSLMAQLEKYLYQTHDIIIYEKNINKIDSSIYFISKNV